MKRLIRNDEGYFDIYLFDSISQAVAKDLYKKGIRLIPDEVWSAHRYAIDRLRHALDEANENLNQTEGDTE